MNYVKHIFVGFFTGLFYFRNRVIYDSLEKNSGVSDDHQQCQGDPLPSVS